MPCQMYCVYPAVCMDIYGYAYTTYQIKGKKQLMGRCANIWLSMAKRYSMNALSWQMKVKDINERLFP